MFLPAPACDDWAMTVTADRDAGPQATVRPASQTPSAGSERRLPRSSDRIVAGVAGAYAARWRVEPTVVRAAVGLLTLVGGLGLVLYVIGVATTSPPTIAHTATVPQTMLDRRRELAVGAATVAVLMVARTSGLWPGDGIMVPATLVAIAVVLVWTPGRAERTDHPARHLARPAIRVTAGLVLAISGVATLAERTGGLADVGRSASAIAVAIAGLAVIAAPLMGRLLARLDDERTLRVREEERATMAAHLHDSVLQTLVLIQRADDSRQMTNLARRQERELRSWLYGARPMGEPTTLAAAVEAMTATIEVDHTVRIDTVTVGDHPLDETTRAFLGAMREAVTNAARHAGAGHIDVFVEVDDRELVGYARDTGVGFDPGAVPADRHGLRDSIIGRTERAGGTATVISHPGTGTEVEIRIPRNDIR